MTFHAQTLDPIISPGESHPAGIWYLSATSAIYCFSFGTLTSLLVLYFIHQLHMPSAQAYSVFAAVNSLLFTLPLAGGYFAGKLGYKYATVIGGLFCLLGTILLTFDNVTAMYVGLAAFVTGNGLLTPATYSLVGLSYSMHDSRRDSGYTLYYLMFNIGFLLSIAAGGYLARDLGYNHTFIFAAVGVALSLLIFISSLKRIQPYPGSSMQPQVNWSPAAIISALIVIGLVGIPLSACLLMYVQVDNAVLWILAIGATIGMLIAAFTMKDKLACLKLLAFLLLSIISVAFWSLYMLEPSMVEVFIESNVNRHVFGQVIPPSTYYSLDALFVILLGIVFSWLWRYLARHKKDISLPAKFSSSLISMGLGYLIFVAGIHFADKNYLTNSGWIVLGYAFLASAELLISPIGLAMVGRLMPKGKDGLGMGVWQLFTGLSAVISGYLANMATVPTKGLPVDTNPIFASALAKIGLGTLIIGILTLFLIPFIKRLIKD